MNDQALAEAPREVKTFIRPRRTQTFASPAHSQVQVEYVEDSGRVEIVDVRINGASVAESTLAFFERFGGARFDLDELAEFLEGRNK